MLYLQCNHDVLSSYVTTLQTMMDNAATTQSQIPSVQHSAHLSSCVTGSKHPTVIFHFKASQNFGTCGMSPESCERISRKSWISLCASTSLGA